MRIIPKAAIDLVVRWEDLQLRAYPDPATGGEPFTIGYGHTGAVKLGDRLTKLQAHAFLIGDLKAAAARIEQRIGPVINDLTENQYAALLSFVFNLGANPKWTIWKRLRARQFDQVPGQLILFVNANGKKMQGLVNRRTDEIRVWSTDEPGSDDVRLTSAALRDMDTPPTVGDVVPAHRSASIWTAITAPFVALWAAVVGWMEQAPDWLKQAIAIVNPFSDQSTVVQHMVAGLATTAAVVGVVNAILQAKKKQESRS